MSSHFSKELLTSVVVQGGFLNCGSGCRLIGIVFRGVIMDVMTACWRGQVIESTEIHLSDFMPPVMDETNRLFELAFVGIMLCK